MNSGCTAAAKLSRYSQYEVLGRQKRLDAVSNPITQDLCFAVGG